MTPASNTINTDSGRKKANNIPTPKPATPTPTVFAADIIIKTSCSVPFYAGKRKKVTESKSFSPTYNKKEVMG